MKNRVLFVALSFSLLLNNAALAHTPDAVVAAAASPATKSSPAANPAASPAASPAATPGTDKGNIPKSELPSQEESLPEGAERGPKVINNPAPAKTDKVGATEIKDANPATPETVDESKTPKLISVPGKSGRTFSVKAAKERKTMAIALGGGGARGAAHIGVLRVLEQEHIPIDYIVGNSMGAIIGGSYAAGVPLDDMQRRGEDGSLRKAYLPSVTARIIGMPIAKLFTIWKKDYAGIISGKKFQRYLESYLPNKGDCWENMKVPFSAVATNLLDGNAYRISEGNLATAIRASASISPLLKPVEIEDRVYVDGGMRANLPASAAKDTKADVIVAVLVDEPLRESPKKRFYHFKGIAERLADVVLAVADEHQLQFADVVINPDVSGIPVLSDKPEDALKAVKAGEEAARKALPLIRQKMGLPSNAQLVGQPAQL